MNREEVYERLLPVFKDVFDDKTIKINDSTCSSDVAGWDSLVHIQLIDAIQDEFDIEFSVDQAYALRNVGDLVSLILNTMKGN